MYTTEEEEEEEEEQEEEECISFIAMFLDTQGQLKHKGK